MDTNPILPSSFDLSWCAARLTSVIPKSYGYDMCYQEGVMSWGISLDGPTVLPVPRSGDALAIHSTSVIVCVILKDQLVKGCLPAGITGVPLKEPPGYREAEPDARSLDVMVDVRDSSPTNAEDR